MPTVRFEQINTFIVEGSVFSNMLTLSEPTNVAVTVVIEGSPERSGDMNIGPLTVTFPAGTSSTNFLSAIFDDAIHEGDETFTFRIVSATNAMIDPGANRASGTIVDNDPPTGPIVEFNPATLYGVNEGAGFIDLPLRLTQSVAGQVTVTLQGSTSGAADFDTSLHTVVFEAGQTAATARFAIVNDSVVEAEELFQITLVSAKNATINRSSGNASSVGLKISDNDQAGVIVGTTNFDHLIGDGNANSISGVQGNDVLAGLGGDDLLDGGEGEDVADYGASAAGVVATIRDGYAEDGLGGRDVLVAIEHLYGSAFGDVLVGNAGSNVLAGQGGADQLYGLGGDDVIEGEAGADLIDGGEGKDRVTFQYAAAGVVVSLRDGYAEDGYGARDRLVSIEDIYGSRFFDVLVGAAGANEIRAGAGNDLLIGHGGNDVLDGGAEFDIILFPDTPAGVVVSLRDGYAEDGLGGRDLLASIERVDGSQHADIVVGSANAEELYGLHGDDQLFGLEGNDVIGGGGGSDLIDGGPGVDTLVLADSSTGPGAVATLRDGYAEDSLGGRDTLVGIENLVGSAFADILVGSSLDNHLTGGDGADQLFGLEGNDRLVGEIGNDRLDGGTGLDTADFFNAARKGVVATIRDGYAEDGLGGRDVLVGIENIVGTVFDDLLVGDAGFNHLRGDFGKDTLVGAGGSDLLEGGPDDDLFIFTTFTGTATITGFVAGASGGDRVDISAHATIDDFAALLAAASNTMNGVLIDLGNGATITISNTTREELTAPDFII